MRGSAPPRATSSCCWMMIWRHLPDSWRPIAGHIGSTGRERVVGAAPIVVCSGSPPFVRYMARRFPQRLDATGTARIPVGPFGTPTPATSRPRATCCSPSVGSTRRFRSMGTRTTSWPCACRTPGSSSPIQADALAHQHYEKTFAGFARDGIARGRTAVLFAGKHPEIVDQIKLSEYHQRLMALAARARAALAAEPGYDRRTGWVVGGHWSAGEVGATTARQVLHHGYRFPVLVRGVRRHAGAADGHRRRLAAPRRPAGVPGHPRRMSASAPELARERPRIVGGQPHAPGIRAGAALRARLGRRLAQAGRERTGRSAPDEISAYERALPGAPAAAPGPRRGRLPGHTDPAGRTPPSPRRLAAPLQALPARPVCAGARAADRGYRARASSSATSTPARRRPAGGASIVRDFGDGLVLFRRSAP